MTTALFTLAGIGVLIAAAVLYLFPRESRDPQTWNAEALEHIQALYRIREYFASRNHKEAVDCCNQLGKCFFCDLP